MPLAIRAAGSLLAVTDDLDPVVYATRLKDERNRLEHIGKEGVEIDVAASFNLSYERLPPEAALVFRLLSVFPGTFDALAEKAVCDDAGHAVLTALVRLSLVLYDTTTKRYRLHDLARLFANSKLNAEERTLGHKRHATHYKDVLATANALYLQGGEALNRSLALFDIEWGNIQAGHAWVAAQGVKADEAIGLLNMTYPIAGTHVLDLRQHSREQISWLEIALTTARRMNHRGNEGFALGGLGIAYAQLGETQNAIQFHEQYLLIARELGDRGGEATALSNLGLAYVDLDEIQRAIQFYEQALVIHREVGDRRGESAVLGNLGFGYAQLDVIPRAIQFYEQALVIDREIGDRRGEGVDLGNLGLAYYSLGETPRAIQFYEQALLIHREVGDRRGEGTTLWNMSLALGQLGQRAQAIQHAEQSLTIYEQIEDPGAARVRAALAEWREGSTSN